MEITPLKALKIFSGIIVVIVLISIISKLLQPSQKKIELPVGGEVFKGVNILDQTEDRRYLLLGVVEDGQTKNIVYDTENNNFIDNSNLFVKEDALYSTKEKENVLDIFMGNELIYSVDLLQFGFEKISEEASTVNVQWSSTNKYLFVYQFASDKLYNNLLIDTVNRTIVQLPVKGITEIKWSSDDKKAILNYLTESVNENYRWNIVYAYVDFETGDFKEINFYGDWIPNSHYVFSEDMERYNMNDGLKKDSIHVGKSVHRETISWITPDKVVLITTGTKFRMTDAIPFVGAFLRFLRPIDQHANIINFNKMRLKEKTINASVVVDFYWSSDYNYLFYTNNNYNEKGLYKMKVNFGK